VPEIIDPVFAKTSQNARFLLSENERFGLVFVKTGSINSGTGLRLKAYRRNYTARSQSIQPSVMLAQKYTSFSSFFVSIRPK
jgi:hypothetical protein